MTHLIWETSTAYDFFISLTVLNKPNKWGLRGSWAKGVRARLPLEAREFLEAHHEGFFAPIPWLYQLPKPLDSAGVLKALSEIPARHRLAALTKGTEMPSEVMDLLEDVGDRQAWDEKDRDRLWSLTKHGGYEAPMDELTSWLDRWSQAERFGEQVLESLQAYYDVFFAEEEERIRPALIEEVERSKALAAEHDLPALMELLSEGILFDSIADLQEQVMVPSFWIAPLIIMTKMSPERGLFVFGGRPANASLVPGEVVPDALHRTLKALADPTRLRILRYLEGEPMNPTELARRLRLRPPTVIHHLNTLRLAGLVFVTFDEKRDKRYAARTARVDEMNAQLRSFLKGDRKDVDIPREIRELGERPPTVA
jgi:DNA-binding transcriptional ArsR family regulator